MLYVANFSYSNYDDEFENACLMPAVVDAPDYDTATERFRALLEKLHDESPLLEGAESIYLDSIVELSEAPTEPVLIQWQKLVASDEGLYADTVLIQWQKLVASDEGLYADTVPLPGSDEIARVCNLPEDEVDDEGDEDDEDDEDYEDEDEDAEDFEDDEELEPEDLADAITQALDFLFGDDLVDVAGDALDADEEPFITF